MDILHSSGIMQIGRCAWYCAHSCQSYAACLFMLDFLKSIYFALGMERPSEIFGQMLSTPASSNPLRVVTQWSLVSVGLVWASVWLSRACLQRMPEVFDVAVCSASAGSGRRGRNRLLLCFTCCDEDHAIPFHPCHHERGLLSWWHVS